MTDRALWIESIINSAAHLPRPAPPEDLHQRIVQEWALRSGKGRRLPARVVWSLAAGLLLLVSVNVYSIMSVRQSRRVADRQASARAVANEYFSSISQ